MKLTLRQKVNLTIAVLLAGLFMMMLCGGNMLLLFLGMAVGLGSVVMNAAWYRCPHCGEYLGRSGWPKFCSHCGEEIDYDVKP